MFIPDPESWLLSITDPWSRIQQEQQIFCPTILVAANITRKLFYFWSGKEKSSAKLQRIVVLFIIIQKIVTDISKIWVWDPDKTYFGSRVRDLQHWAS